MHGTWPILEETLDYETLAKPARPGLLECRFPGLLPINKGLSARGVGFVGDVFGRCNEAARLILDVRDPNLPYFPGVWEWTVVPVKSIDHGAKELTVPIHSAFFAMAFRLINDINNNGASIENLGRYHAMINMRRSLDPAIEGGLEDFVFSGRRRTRGIGEFARYVPLPETGRGG